MINLYEVSSVDTTSLIPVNVPFSWKTTSILVLYLRIQHHDPGRPVHLRISSFSGSKARSGADNPGCHFLHDPGGCQRSCGAGCDPGSSGVVRARGGQVANWHYADQVRLEGYLEEEG